MTLTQQTISQLRDTARAHGITTGLFGTSKQALIVKINLAERAAPAPARTTIGDFLVWFSAEHQGLRMARTSAPATEYEYEVEAFSRSERSTAHSLFMAATAAATPAIPHIRAHTCTESGAHRFIAEASELGWKPGYWPERASTNMGNGLDFILTARTADGTRIYRQANGCISLEVLND